MELALVGQEVGRLCLDYAVVIETVNATELRIESPFQFSSAGSAQLLEVHPDRLNETGSAVVGLLRQQIVDASVSNLGELYHRFAHGERLQCPPDAKFEAWTLVTASGERMVCLPGGGVAHWPSASSR